MIYRCFGSTPDPDIGKCMKSALDIESSKHLSKRKGKI